MNAVSEKASVKEMGERKGGNERGVKKMRKVEGGVRKGVGGKDGKKEKKVERLYLKKKG